MNIVEEIKRLSDDYGLTEKTVIKHYQMLIERINNEESIDPTDELKIISCLERIVSERASIKETTGSPNDAYTLEQTIERAISDEYGLGLLSDSFTDEEAYKSFVFRTELEELEKAKERKYGKK